MDFKVLKKNNLKAFLVGLQILSGHLNKDLNLEMETLFCFIYKKMNNSSNLGVWIVKEKFFTTNMYYHALDKEIFIYKIIAMKNVLINLRSVIYIKNQVN